MNQNWIPPVAIWLGILLNASSEQTLKFWIIQAGSLFLFKGEHFLGLLLTSGSISCNSNSWREVGWQAGWKGPYSQQGSSSLCQLRAEGCIVDNLNFCWKNLEPLDLLKTFARQHFPIYLVRILNNTFYHSLRNPLFWWHVSKSTDFRNQEHSIPYANQHHQTQSWNNLRTLFEWPCQKYFRASFHYQQGLVWGKKMMKFWKTCDSW